MFVYWVIDENVVLFFYISDGSYVVDENVNEDGDDDNVDEDTIDEDKVDDDEDGNQ